MARKQQTWTRKQLRAEHRAYVRENVWWYVGLASLAGVGAALILGFSLWRDRVPMFSGFLAGVLVGAVAMLLAGAFYVHGPTRMSRLNGIEAEDWIDDVIRQSSCTIGRARNLVVGGREVDSVVVTPRGVLAVEVKWHQDFDPQVREADLDQAWRHGQKVRSLLRSKGFEGRGLPVVPVLIICGPGFGDGGASVADEVEVVRGHDLRTWLHGCASGPVPRDLGEAVVAQLANYAHRQAKALVDA